MWLIWTLVVSVYAQEKPQPGYGYVGPACAVVDGTLFLHGVARRVLSQEETSAFGDYQRQLTLFTQGFHENDAPIVPSFCGGYDDSVEVILSSCIVRNNHVYKGDTLIRPLSNPEKRRLATVISRRNRSKRSLDPSMVKQHDFSALLHKFLNVNSSVTSRFLPIVSQSPLFSMEGAFEGMLGGKSEEQGTTASETTPTTTSMQPKTRATFKPHTKTTRKRLATKSMYTTSATTEATPTKKSPERMRPLYVAKKAPKKVTTTTAASIVFPAEETVKDPILLQLIAQALENNQLLDNILHPTTPPPSTSVPFLSQPDKGQSPVNLRFVSPSSTPWNTPSIPGPTPNVPFSPHMSYTSLGGSESNRRRKPTSPLLALPDEICSADGRIKKKTNLL